MGSFTNSREQEYLRELMALKSEKQTGDEIEQQKVQSCECRGKDKFVKDVNIWKLVGKGGWI